MKKHDHDILYLHCQNCIKNNRPSGKHEVSISDKGIVVVCGSCAKIVFLAEAKRFEKLVKDLMSRGCQACQEAN